MGMGGTTCINYQFMNITLVLLVGRKFLARRRRILYTHIVHVTEDRRKNVFYHCASMLSAASILLYIFYDVIMTKHVPKDVIVCVDFSMD